MLLRNPSKPNVFVLLTTVSVVACQPGLQEAGLNAPDPVTRPVAIIDVTSLVDDLELDIRYAGTENFVGERIDGYLSSKCLVHEDAAARLLIAQQRAKAEGLRLKIFDCYRPQRAVDHFLRWAADPADVRTREAYYPNELKPELIGPYIAARSGHSRAAAIDLTLVERDGQGGWVELDMGTPFDFFDARSNTDDPRITAEQRANRYRLRSLMIDAGFKPYDLEWWHFSIADEPYPETFFDFPVE